MNATSLNSDMINWFKVSVWDFAAGAWIVRHVSIRTKSRAQAIVDDYSRDGKVARWSRHIGGDYHYSR